MSSSEAVKKKTPDGGQQDKKFCSLSDFKCATDKKSTSTAFQFSTKATDLVDLLGGFIVFIAIVFCSSQNLHSVANSFLLGPFSSCFTEVARVTKPTEMSMQKWTPPRVSAGYKERER